MNFARMETIYETLRRRGARAALEEFSEAEIREVAQRYGIHLPDRPLQPETQTQYPWLTQARQEYNVWLKAQRERAKRQAEAQTKHAQAIEAAAARRRQKFTAPVSDEDERYARAWDDSINVLDRPRWAHRDTQQCNDMREARAAWTFATGSDDNLTRKLPAPSLTETLDNLLRPDRVYAERDTGPAPFRPTMRHAPSRSRLNAYLDALDHRVQTFEAAEAEPVDDPDLEPVDARVRLVQLAVADAIPHLTTCWSASE